MRRRHYEAIYRLMAILHIPKRWVFGSADSLLERVIEEHALQPGRALDLGCGVGGEAVCLARRGYRVTGVDFSPTSLRLARRHAINAGVEVELVEADLTRPLELAEPFDLVVDIGTLNDIPPPRRDGYVANVLRLTRPGSLFVLFGFEKQLPGAERAERFAPAFAIETVDDRMEPFFRRRMITSLLTRMDGQGSTGS